MAGSQVSARITLALRDVMVKNELKLEYVAYSASVGVETVRRVKDGQTDRLWDRTARRLSEFLETETEGVVTASELLSVAASGQHYGKRKARRSTAGLKERIIGFAH